MLVHSFPGRSLHLEIEIAEEYSTLLRATLKIQCRIDFMRGVGVRVGLVSYFGFWVLQDYQFVVCYLEFLERVGLCLLFSVYVHVTQHRRAFPFNSGASF